jgi:hypothetical protein
VRIQYRLHQFWRTLSIKTNPLDVERAQALLSPEQRQLFARLQRAEKSHALAMLRRLVEQGEKQPDLLVAVLLHDVGKLRYRLQPLERAMVVLIKAINPAWAHRWGRLTSHGWENVLWWRKAFVLAEHHAEWGAEMARQAGVSRLAETLIREHHHPHSLNTIGAETNLLRKLWVVDNEN